MRATAGRPVPADRRPDSWRPHRRLNVSTCWPHAEQEQGVGKISRCASGHDLTTRSEGRPPELRLRGDRARRRVLAGGPAIARPPPRRRRPWAAQRPRSTPPRQPAASRRRPALARRRRPPPPHYSRLPRPTPKRFGLRRRPGSRRPVLPTSGLWTIPPPDPQGCGPGSGRSCGASTLDALRQLQVPADTAADLQDLIRIVSPAPGDQWRRGIGQSPQGRRCPLPNPLGQNLAQDMAGCDASPVRPRPAATPVSAGHPGGPGPPDSRVSLTGGADVARRLRPAARANTPEASRHLAGTTSTSDGATAV